MNAWLLRSAGAGLMILLGMFAGAWVTTSHFRPLLDAEQNQVSSCKAARDNLAGLAQEQGKALGDLQLSSQKRQADAEKAVADARASAEPDYQAANRIQQERIGGDQCRTAASIIDQELGL